MLSWANQGDIARHSLWLAGSTAGMSDWQSDVNNYLTKARGRGTPPAHRG